MLADRWRESYVDLWTAAVQSVQTAACFDFSLQCRRGSRNIAAQRRMRHDTSRDAINDETGNKTRPSRFVYRNQTRPQAPIPKCGWEPATFVSWHHP